MATKEITDSSFDSDVINAEGLVLVDFWAEWCEPCKVVGVSLEDLSDELGGQVTIAKLDFDENQDTASKFGVQSVPTMILFKNGQPVSKKVGVVPKGQIKEWLEGELA